jgi:DNA-binding LacI/PurR family transcriptional regulator
VTMYDVAQAAGVSHQTVANVLKAPQRVAPSTRELVEHHISRLGYRPNRIAQNLTDKRSRLIGMRVEARSSLASGGILDAFLHGVAEAADSLDLHLVLFHSEPGVAEVDKARELYHASVADAFIIAETVPGDARVGALVAAQLPFVAFGRIDTDESQNWVDTDNEAGSRLATRHLVELGHRDIAFLGWPGDSLVGDDRRRGWRNEMDSHGLPHGDDRVAYAVNDRRAAEEALEPFLSARHDITAVVAASDELALGVETVAARLDRDISVVGYDDSALASAGHGLTTVHQPVGEISRRIVQIAARLIAGDDAGPTHNRVTPQLVVRGSTSPRPSTSHT